MQRTDNTEKAKTARRRVGNSTTLNRKYVERPAKSTSKKNMANTVKSETTKRNVEIRHFRNSSDGMVSQMAVSKSVSRFSATPMLPAGPVATVQDMGVQPHPLQEVANSRMRKRKIIVKKEEEMTAKELKDKAIREALATASATNMASKQSKTKKKSKSKKIHFGFGRLMLALACTAVAVFAIVYFVNLNMPDVSLKVAAMQTGINATYPTYVPRDYSISSITSEDKKIVLEFKNFNDGNTFTLVEEASSWDSNALLSNYVKETFEDSYQMIKEQGLTIFINGSNATWVNGGVVYKLTAANGTLTNKQIKTIATSL